MNSSEALIEVRRVDKEFYRFHRPVLGAACRLLGLPPRAGTYETFQAVRDVSFEVSQGQVVGLIGPNGSGKTTLLKMISGLLPVDRGSIAVRGRVHALLALGAGVNPDFTGRENIYYSGLLLGMSKAEILERTPSVIEFAELGAFIDQPFRTYSSGMRARLLFSISMSVTPDILIVDEALATGDVAFVEKCLGRVRALLAGGVTMLFVSHNLSQVRQFCDRCLVLEHGVLVFDGDTATAIRRYVDSQHRLAQRRLGAPADGQPSAAEPSDGRMRIEDVFWRANGERSRQLVIGAPCQLVIDLHCERAYAPVGVCVEVRSQKSATTYSYLSQSSPLTAGKAPPTLSLPAGSTRLTLDIPCLSVGDGFYNLDVELFPADPGYQFSYETCYVYQRRVLEWQAIYADEQWFGRGVLAEIPVADVRLEARANA